MIDFACKKFNLEEVMRCILNLSKSELKILRVFISNKNLFLNTQEIQSKTTLDLTTIQRAVKKIYSLGIIERGQTNLSSGGYVFNYRLKSKAEIRNKVISLVDNWAEKVGREFDKW